MPRNRIKVQVQVKQQVRVQGHVRVTGGYSGGYIGGGPIGRLPADSDDPEFEWDSVPGFEGGEDDEVRARIFDEMPEPRSILEIVVAPGTVSSSESEARFRAEVKKRASRFAEETESDLTTIKWLVSADPSLPTVDTIAFA